jgi:hypothetical protein
VSYAVIWQPTAESMLADIWIHAVDRNAVTVAANQIDVRLANDPFNEGESREEPFRILFESPLVVDYQIVADAKEVRVLLVRTMRRA